ncbi:MAG: PilZ domain-containing protein [Desulfurobacteriaceae bacterium]
MDRINFFKLPTADSSTVFLFLFITIAFIIFLTFAGRIKEYLKEKQLRESFFKEAKERGLTREEAQILWFYSKKLGRDPFLALEFKAPFEKVINLYLKLNPNAKEEMIQDMRMKLGFDHVPYFVPLTSTKDIDLFQPAKLQVGDDLKVDVVLFDKDERYMYWALIKGSLPDSIVNQKVNISFIRKGDGIYKLEGTVVKTFTDNGRLILQIPHTFELSRYQRREYARVEVELPCDIGILDKKENKIKWLKGKIVDISAGGVKICIPLSELKEELVPMTEINLRFSLEDKSFNLKSIIVNVQPHRKSNCYGVKFEKINPDEQKFIHNFVKKEQQRLAQLAMKNRS